MKKTLAIILATLTLTGLTGCFSSSTSKANDTTNSTTEATTSNETTTDAQPEDTPRMIVDQYDYEVEIPNNIERVAIVQLLPLPAVFASYQGGDVSSLVLMPPDSLNAAEKSILKDYAPDILNVTVDPLKNGQINIEEIIALNPDIIFYSGKDNHELFDAAGIPSVGFSTVAGGKNPIETVAKWIEQLELVFQKESKLVGVLEYGHEVMADVTLRTQNIAEEDKKKVLMISTFNDSAINVGGFSEYWISAFNGDNVAKGAQNGSTNIEQIYEWNPEVIFLSSLTDVMPENIFNNTVPGGQDWSNIDAVKNKAVYKFPVGIHRWWPPTPESPLSLYWQASMVYPELFEDIDMAQTTKDYFSNFLNMELSDEQVDSIFNPVENLGRQ